MASNEKSQETDNHSKKGLIILIIAQVIVIILGLVTNIIWNSMIKEGYDYDKKVMVYEQTISTLKQSLRELTNQIEEISKENKDLFLQLVNYKKRLKNCNPIPITPEPEDESTQQIIDKTENIYNGTIDISFWPEIKGKNFLLDEKNIYPIKKIQSFCFDVVDGSAMISLTTIDNESYKHVLDEKFYTGRNVKLRGNIIKEFKLSEISCLIFQKIK